MRRVLVAGTVGAILVTLGGMVTATLPASSSVARFPILEALRGAPSGRMAGLTIVVLGLGILAHAWLHLLPFARDRRWGVARSQVACAVWSLPLLVAPPLFSRDGWSYAAQGFLQSRGLSPYEFTPALLEGPIVEAVDPRWLDTAAPYGPVPLLWGGLVSDLTFDPWVTVLGHRVLALAGVALLAWAVPRLAGYSGADPRLATWLVLPAPLTLAHGVGGLHNDILMAGLMAVALVLAIERSWLLAAAVGGLAAAVKLPGGVVCVGVVLLSLGVRATLADRAWRIAGVAVVSAGTLVGVGLMGRLGIGWVHALGVPATVNTPLSLSTDLGLGLGWLTAHLGIVAGPGGVLGAVRLLGSAVALAAAGWLMLTRPTGVRPAGIAAAAAALLGLTVLSPVLHPWYSLWCLPLLAVVPLRTRPLSAVVSATLVLAVTAPLDSSLQGRAVPIWVAIALVVAVGASLLGRLGILPESDSAERPLVVS